MLHNKYFNTVIIKHLLQLLFMNNLIKITVHLKSHSVSQTNRKKQVLHFHYLTWPDFGVPSCPTEFLNFLMAVRKAGALEADVGPAVIHCSAGIGRSGTFCLVDTCLLLVRYLSRFLLI